MEEQFKEATRSDCSYIDGGNLTSLQHVIERRANQFAPMKKNVLRENDKLHTDMQLRKAIMKRSRFTNNVNRCGKPADKTAYKIQRKLVAELNKEAKPFLKTK